MNSFLRGNLVRFRVLFVTQDTGAATDPTTVKLFYKHRSTGETTELEYPSGSEIVREDTGSFYADVEVDTADRWEWRWEASGDLIAASEGAFNVQQGAFP